MIETRSPEPRNGSKPLLALPSCSFALFQSRLVVLRSHWRPEIQIYCHKRGGGTNRPKTTAPKNSGCAKRPPKKGTWSVLRPFLPKSRPPGPSGGSARRRKALAAKKSSQIAKTRKSTRNKRQGTTRGCEQETDVLESTLVHAREFARRAGARRRCASGSPRARQQTCAKKEIPLKTSLFRDTPQSDGLSSAGKAGPATSVSRPIAYPAGDLGFIILRSRL